MVARDDHFVRVRLRVKPVKLRLHLGKRAVLGEVSGVEENVARRKWPRGGVVCVGDADQANWVAIAASTVQQLCWWRFKLAVLVEYMQPTGESLRHALPPDGADKRTANRAHRHGDTGLVASSGAIGAGLLMLGFLQGLKREAGERAKVTNGAGPEKASNAGESSSLLGQMPRGCRLFALKAQVAPIMHEAGGPTRTIKVRWELELGPL
jgi:hypothetical protein